MHPPARAPRTRASKPWKKHGQTKEKTQKYKQATRRHVGATLVGQGSPPWPAGPAEAWQIGGKAGFIAAAPRKALAERLGLQQKGGVYNIKAGFIAERLVYRSYAPQRSCRKAGFIAAMPRTAFAERQDLSQKGWIYTRKAGFIAAMPRKAFAERLDLSQKGWVYRSYAQQGPCRKAELGVPCLAFHIDRKLGNW